MKNFSLGYIASLAVWWATLLATWVEVTGAAVGRLSAPALSAALGAIPVVLLLTLFLILYTPFRKSLLIFASSSYALGAWLSLQSPASQPAVVNLIAEQTGVADAPGQAALVSVSTTMWPTVAAVSAILAGIYCIAWAFRAAAITSRERAASELPEDDLWRETSAG